MEKEIDPRRVWLYARIPGDYAGTMNSIQVCAFQAELVYAIGHPQTNGRCRGDPAAKKINMAVQKAEDMALPKGFCKSHCDFPFHLVNTCWVIVFLQGLEGKPFCDE